jgi:hypothetical protein
MDLVSALEDQAALRDVPQTEIVEEALRRALGVAEEGSAAGPLGGVPPSQHESGREGNEPSNGGSRAAPTARHVVVPARPAFHQPRRVDLVAWLSQAAGMPKALCGRFVRDGRVLVHGLEHRDDMVHEELLDDVRLDGEPVSPAG